MKRHIEIIEPSDWKAAIRQALDKQGTTRYAFIKRCVEREICSQHNAQCLLADDGTVTGTRRPSFATAIRMANEAGFDVILRPR